MTRPSLRAERRTLATALCALVWLAAGLARAHDPAFDEPLPSLPEYLGLGITHVLIGYDHLAFLLGLSLLAASPRALLGSVTAFTAAHSISLAACVLELVVPDSRSVEVLIALSIAYVALAQRLRLPRGRGVGIALLFGFVHGFGFAGALEEVGVPSDSALSALALFNLGVELGQLAVLALLLPVLSRLRARPALFTPVLQGTHLALFLLGIGLALERSQWLWQPALQLGASS